MVRHIDTETPTADHVLKLLDGAKISNAVVQACNLQLFDELQKSPLALTVEELVKQKDWEPDPLRRLMDMMVSLNLLSKTQNSAGDDIYANTESGRLLVKDGPPAMHEYAMMVNDDVTSIQQLAKTIKKSCNKSEVVPGETKEPDGGSETAYSEQGYYGSFPPEFWIKIYRMCEGIAKPYADQIMTSVDLSKHKRVVDLGGGSGVFSYALLKAYPEMNVILAELPAALPIIEEHFVSKKPDPRITTLVVDYNKDVLPESDLYVLGNVVHSHDPVECKELLNKIHTALTPGGGVMIIDQLLNDRKDGPPLAHAWDLAFYGMGMMYSGKEITAMLEACNFGNAQIIKTQDCCTSDVVYATKK